MRDGFIKVAAATPEIKVAHCDYNAKACIALIEQAARQGVKVLTFPELVLTGSTCGDLFYQDTLIRGAEEALDQILEATADLDMLIAIGLPVRGEWDGKLYNCAAVISSGSILALVPKTHLTQAERRWFSVCSNDDAGAVICGERCDLSPKALFACSSVAELVVGVEIGSDLYAPVAPSAALAQAGATLILNPAAHNAMVGADDYRRALVTGQSGRLLCGYVSANAGEGESTTDLVFTGHDLIAERGELLAETDFATGLTVSEIDVAKLAYERRRTPGFTTTDKGFWRAVFDLDVEGTELTRFVGKNPFVPEVDREKRCAQILNIAALGLKKRLSHTYAKTAVVGLSGGLDSTLALLITARAMKMLGRPMTDILCVTMPCFGTTARTKSNAEVLAERIGTSFKTVHIAEAVSVHFRDIGQSMDDLSVTFENSQARERTQVLMDLANQMGGMVIGTGDLSELALGWATYNGDHMSMYAVNGAIPKMLVRYLVAYEADLNEKDDPLLAACLRDILDTPVSPELLPPKEGEIAQKTEDLVGPYQLHDFFLYYAVRWGFSPRKVYRLAQYALGGEYSDETLLKWLNNFYRRFFTQQFKRSCLPDGPKVGTVTLSPRGDWAMPSDAVNALWMEELNTL